MSLVLQLHLVMMSKYSKFGVVYFNTFCVISYIKFLHSNYDKNNDLAMTMLNFFLPKRRAKNLKNEQFNWYCILLIFFDPSRSKRKVCFWLVIHSRLRIELVPAYCRSISSRAPFWCYLLYASTSAHLWLTYGCMFSRKCHTETAVLGCVGTDAASSCSGIWNAGRRIHKHTVSLLCASACVSEGLMKFWKLP